MNTQTISEITKRTLLLGPLEVVCAKKIVGMCCLSYYKHPKGCPMWGRKEGCPPETPYFLDVYESEIFVALVEFDFEAFLKMRKRQCPKWTERARRNPRHWQGHVRAILRRFVEQSLTEGYEAIFTPEGMGIDVTKTCKSVGIALQWPPETLMYQVAVFAKPKR